MHWGPRLIDTAAEAADLRIKGGQGTHRLGREAPRLPGAACDPRPSEPGRGGATVRAAYTANRGTGLRGPERLRDAARGDRGRRPGDGIIARLQEAVEAASPGDATRAIEAVIDAMPAHMSAGEKEDVTGVFSAATPPMS